VLAKCVAHNLCCVVKVIFTAGLGPTFWPDATAEATVMTGSALALARSDP